VLLSDSGGIVALGLIAFISGITFVRLIDPNVMMGICMYPSVVLCNSMKMREIEPHDSLLEADYEYLDSRAG
jgi:hypothetical protein